MRNDRFPTSLESGHIQAYLGCKRVAKIVPILFSSVSDHSSLLGTVVSETRNHVYRVSGMVLALADLKEIGRNGNQF
jgi:hypothetical protein